MLLRLQKYLAQCGVASRRQSERLIEAGEVRVNGQPAKLGQSIDPAKDVVTLRSLPLTPPAPLVYYLIHKPRQVVSTTRDDSARRTITSFIPGKTRLYPVGRLDYDSEGLMLLTNDGALTQKLTHPKFEVNKTYRVLVKGVLTPQAITHLESGAMIEGKKTAPATLTVVERQPHNTWLDITIHEGRNRQIRKMCEAVGFPVLRLIRTQLGEWQLGDLKPGQYREISLPLTLSTR